MSKDKLNPRQAAVIKKIVQGKSQTQAYKEVYGVTDDNHAAVNSSRLLRKTKAQNALQRAMRRRGIDEDSIVDKLIEIGNKNDWRAKDAYVEKSARFLGYSDDHTGVNIIGKMNVDFVSYNE